MTGIVITSPDAERLARSFRVFISKAGLSRIRRKAVTEVGKAARMELRALAPAVYGTSAAALRIQGKAPSPGDTNPTYRLRMTSGFPVGRLKASHRKTRRRRGKMSLTLTPPHQKAQPFRAVEKEGRAFRLLPAGPLAERYLGDVSTRARVALLPESQGGIDELRGIRRRAERELPDAVSRAIDAHFDAARRRRR